MKRRRVQDAGETLIELIVAIGVLGLAVPSIVAALVLGIVISDTHQKQSVAGAGLKTYAEAIQNYVAASPTPHYLPCAAANAYSPGLVGFTVPATAAGPYNVNQSAAVTYVGGWVACSGNDSGTQRVTLTISTADGRASETLDVIIRNPCRTTDTTCS